MGGLGHQVNGCTLEPNSLFLAIRKITRL
jgi:hypothetical protein